MNTKVIILLVLVVLAVIVMLQNREIVNIQLLFWAVGVPRILLIFIILLIGIAIGYVIANLKKTGKDDTV